MFGYILGRKGCVLYGEVDNNDEDDELTKAERFAALCFLFFVLYFVNMQSYKAWLGSRHVRQAWKYDYYVGPTYTEMEGLAFIFLHGILLTVVCLPLTIV